MGILYNSYSSPIPNEKYTHPGKDRWLATQLPFLATNPPNLGGDPNATPPRNNALLRDYQPSIIIALLRFNALYNP